MRVDRLIGRWRDTVNFHVESRSGHHAIRAKMVIDVTGDGDPAAISGTHPTRGMSAATSISSKFPHRPAGIRVLGNIPLSAECPRCNNIVNCDLEPNLVNSEKAVYW